ncbi:MAG: transcriptional regulator [Thermoprotei archaeon]|nr:MAG: transcriptional regulator [Thermoprotei archaeon]RLF20691.1 MAG: transcriptional regulator [Thermoprotei archaeon]
MSKDQVIGLIILVVSVVVILVYGWLVFSPPELYVFNMPVDIFVLKLTGFLAIAGIFGIIAWIGYTLATTPPPKPIEELEKELEKELKELEKEIKEEKEEEKKEEKAS